jgi:hypothetical protein
MAILSIGAFVDNSIELLHSPFVSRLFLDFSLIYVGFGLIGVVGIPCGGFDVWWWIRAIWGC